MKGKRIKRFLILLLIVIAVGVYFYYRDNRFEQQTELEACTDNPFFLGDVKGSGLEIPLPVGDHQIVEHTGYTLSYNEEYEVADWVAYEFTNEELNTQGTERKDSFRADPDIVTGSAQLADYKNSGYSRGHLAPAADFKWSEQAMKDTFYLSNMTPQKQNNFNAGIWLDAENLVRDLCAESDVVYVVTGPVLTDGPYETIGANEVAVPKCFYKVLLIVDREGNCKSLGMMIPHDADRKSDLSTFFCTVNDVEETTGLDFFYLLDDRVEEIIESFNWI